MKTTPTPRGKVKSLVLGAGEYHEFEISSRESIIVTSSKPVLLAQLCKSFDADNTRNSDPFMTLITPTTQLSNYYAYSTPGLIRYQHYANVIIDVSHLGGIRLDGRALRSSDYLSSWRRAGRDYAVAKLKMAAGFHVLTHASHVRFGAVAYGLKRQESYGFPLGMYARDYRDDFAEHTTEQELVTTPEGFPRTKALTTQEGTSARSTDGTTVGMIPTTDEATTIGSAQTTVTTVVGDVMATTEITDVPFIRDPDGMNNEMLPRNSSDRIISETNAANSTASTQWNSTTNYSATPQLQTITTAPAWNVSNLTLLTANGDQVETTEVPATEATFPATEATFPVTEATFPATEATFEHTNKGISGNVTDSQPLMPTTGFNYTTRFDDSNTTALFLDNGTTSASHLPEKAMGGISTVGPRVVRTGMTEQDNDTTTTSSNSVNTLSHSHTSTLTVSRTESVNVTMNYTDSTFNDTATTTSVQVEGNGSVRAVTVAILSNENTTHGTITAILTTAATVSLPTSVETSTGESDHWKQRATLERNSELLNATTTLYEETTALLNSTHNWNTSKSSTSSTLTENNLNMQNSTNSSAESAVYVTSETSPDAVTQRPHMNHSLTTTFVTNVTETRQQDTTPYSSIILTSPNATRTDIFRNGSSTDLRDETTSLDRVEHKTFRQPLKNKTVTERWATVNVIWNNETYANATIPTSISETYNNITSLPHILFVDDANNTRVVDERANETILREANVSDISTVATTNGTKAKQIRTELPFGTERNITTTENNANDTTENVSASSTSVPLTNASEFVGLILGKNLSTHSNLSDSPDNASLLENTSSLDSTPSTFTEVTSISPMGNVTSSVLANKTTAPNASFILEYFGNTNDSAPERAESVERRFNETTTSSYEEIVENSATSPMTTYPDINDTSVSPITTTNDTIWTTDSVSTTEESTIALIVQNTTKRKTMKSNDSQTATSGIQHITTDQSENTKSSPASTTVDESTNAKTTSAVDVTDSTTSGSSRYIDLSATNSPPDTGVDKLLTNSNIQQTENHTNISTASDANNVHNHDNLTSEITPSSEEMSAKKNDSVRLTATILVATLFGLPLLVLCGCLCYGMCCCVCRKHGRGACCGCANRRRRNTRIRPTSQWSSSSQQSAASSRRSSLVYIDPSVLESRGLVAPPSRKQKLDFLNFYQKPSCSSWVEVIDEQADDKNGRLDHARTSRVKDLRGKIKGKGKRGKSAYGRNRKVGPALDDRPPLPRKDMSSRMQAYIVRN